MHFHLSFSLILTQLSVISLLNMYGRTVCLLSEISPVPYTNNRLSVSNQDQCHLGGAGVLYYGVKSHEQSGSKCTS